MLEICFLQLSLESKINPRFLTEEVGTIEYPEKHRVVDGILERINEERISRNSIWKGSNIDDYR